MSRTKPSVVRGPEGRRAAARERAARREERVRRLLKQWLTRETHAARKVKEYRKKVAYYDRKAKNAVKPQNTEQADRVRSVLRRGQVFDE
jgi:hypothetical protein